MNIRVSRHPEAGESAEHRLRLNQAAADWHVRRHQPDWTRADERALEAWLASDPRHRQALDDIGRTWTEAAQLRDLFPQSYGARPVQREPAAAVEETGPGSADRRHDRLAGALTSGGRTARPGRWALPIRPLSATAAVAAGLVALVAGAYGWHRWDNTSTYTLEAGTARGELRTLALPDGSTIDLNVDSHVQVRYFPRRREVVLDRGEAYFQVAADAGKPFTVDSGRSRVKVVGTAFTVRAAPPELVVKVQEGRVELRPERDNPQGAALTLLPGSGVAIDPQTGRHHSVRAVADTVGEWRTGQIYFRKVPLAQVAEELARYLGQPVRVEGAALALTPVSGLLAVKSPRNFITALPSLIAVDVRQMPDGAWLITD